MIFKQKIMIFEKLEKELTLVHNKKMIAKIQQSFKFTREQEYKKVEILKNLLLKTLILILLCGVVLRDF